MIPNNETTPFTTERLLEKTYSFDSAHKLCDPNLDDTQNAELYGNCSRLHGHRWDVTFYITGNVCKDGMVVNFTELSKLCKELDHQYLNEILPGMLTTAENICEYFLGKVLALDRIFTKVEIEVAETPTASASVSWEAE